MDYTSKNRAGSEKSLSLESETESFNGSSQDKEHLNTGVAAVIRAILSTEIGGFHSYYVDFTPYTSGFEDSLNFEYGSKVDYSVIISRSESLGVKEHVLGQNRVRKIPGMIRSKDDERIE